MSIFNLKNIEFKILSHYTPLYKAKTGMC